MTERIASGEIYIGLQDADALAALRRLDSTFDRTMSNIDRQSATVSIDAEMAKFDDAVTRAKRELKALDKADAQAELKLNDDQFKAHYEEARAKLKRLDGAKAEAEIKWRNDPAGAKVIAAEQKKIEETQKAVVDAYGRMQQNALADDKARTAERLKDYKAAQQAAIDADKARDARHAAVQERALALDKSRDAERLKNYRETQQHAIDIDKARDTVIRKAAEATHQQALDFDAARTASAQRQAATSASLNKQYLSELSSSMSEATAMDKARSRQIAADTKSMGEAGAKRQREIDEVPALEAAYVRLTDKLEKLASAKKRAGGNEKAKFLIEVDARETLQKVEHIRKEVRRRVDRDPVSLAVGVHPAHDAGRNLRLWMSKNQGGLGSMAAAAGMDIGNKLGQGLTSGFQRVADTGVKQTMRNIGSSARGRTSGLGERMGAGMLAGMHRIGKAAEGLGDVAVRLGPLTATIKQAMLGMSLFGPLILDLVGSLGALVSVTGSATLGLGAMAAGIAGGGIPLMLGMGMVIKGVVGDFKNVNKAQKAYDDALRAGNTDLAAKKMKELQAVMGNVSQDTVKTFGTWQKLKDSFKAGTQEGRGSVFTMMAQGIKTAHSLMGQFTADTNNGLSSLEKSTTRWQKGLSSPAGARVLHEMMSNVGDAMGPVLDGLGSLLAYLGRVGAIASRSFTPMANGSKAWAEGVNSVSDGALEGKVRGVMDSLKSVGRFFMATGRLMKAFFSGGVESGQHFADTMTSAMNRWTAFLNTDSGQSSLKQFFSESVAGAQTLFAALAPLATGFVQWAQAIAPIARGFGEVVGMIAQFIGALGKLAGMGGVLTGLGVTLGSLWAVNKIAPAISAVGAFASALMRVEGAAKGVAAANVAGSLTSGAAAARAGAGAMAAAPVAGAAVKGERALASGLIIPRGVATGAAEAEGALLKTEAAAAKTATRFGALRGASGGALTALTGLSPVAAGVTAAVGLAAFGIYKLTTRVSESDKAAKKASAGFQLYQTGLQAMPATNLAAASAATNLAQAELSVKMAQKEVNALRKAGKTGTDEYKQAVINLQGAEQQQVAQKGQMVQATDAERKARASMLKGAQTNLQQTNKELDAFNSKRIAIGNNGRGGVATKALGDAFDDLKAKAKASGKTIREEITDAKLGAGAKKSLNELADVVDKRARAEQRVKAASDQNVLSMLNQQRAARGLTGIAQQAAGAFGNLASKMPKTAGRIALKFTGAGDAAKVAGQASKALKSGVPNRVITHIVAESSSAEQAIKRLQRARLAAKVQKIIESGSGNVMGAIRSIMGSKLATKVQKILAEDSSAKSKISALIALGIPPKTARMIGDNKDALAKARQANAQTLRTLVQAITRNFPTGAGPTPPAVHQNVIRNYTPGHGQADGGMFASGGVVAAAAGRPAFDAQRHGSGALPDRAKQDRAQRTAELSGNPKPLRSGKITKPTLLTGEEATPEFVVSTNPRYRARNMKYAAQAARAVGLKVGDAAEKVAPTLGDAVAAVGRYAGGKGKGKISPVRRAANTTEKFGKFGGGFNPDAVIKRDKVFKPATKKDKKGKLKFKSSRGWATYVEDLQTQQGYWEREVGIRESQVREPEEAVIRAPENDKKITDPTTGDVTTVEAYKANPKVESEYKPDVQLVLNAMKTLREIITEIMRVVPMAIAANRQERSMRADTNDDLAPKIKHEESQSHNKKLSDKQRQKHSDKHDELVGQRDHNIEVNKQLREDEDALVTTRVDAGFSYREAGIAENKLQVEHDTASVNADTKAKADTAANMPTPSTATAGGGDGGGGGGSGSSGSGTDGITYGQQQGLAAVEQAGVLAAFGSNFLNGTNAAVSQITGSGGFGGAGTPGGGQTNQSGVQGGGVAADLTAGRSTFQSSGAAASAVASGTTASRGVAGSSGGTDAAPSGPANVVVNNTFATVPPDPHTWSQGVAFELAGTL